jgi:mannose-6-phosphate isomerase-like protein (cupin superfamily)
MLTQEQRDIAFRRVEQYRTRANGMMSLTMMNEVEIQFVHMAKGGDGSVAMMGNIRDEYYEGYPDKFFQVVCDMMGWEY